MPTLITKFSFPEDIVFNDEMAFYFIKAIDFKLNKEILKHYKVDTINKDVMMNIKNDLIKEGTYGGDDEGWAGTLFWIVSKVMESKELREYFNFVWIDEKWDDEGSNRYYYYKYVSTDKLVKDAEKEIKKQIDILKKYGKKVDFNIY
jgi:hypothetical protein